MDLGLNVPKFEIIKNDDKKVSSDDDDDETSLERQSEMQYSDKLAESWDIYRSEQKKYKREEHREKEKQLVFLGFQSLENIYQTSTLTLDQLNSFFNKHIKGQKFNVGLIGNKENLDWNAVQKLGTIKELTLEDLFNY